MYTPEQLKLIEAEQLQRIEDKKYADLYRKLIDNFDSISLYGATGDLQINCLGAYPERLKVELERL